MTTTITHITGSNAKTGEDIHTDTASAFSGDHCAPMAGENESHGAGSVTMCHLMAQAARLQARELHKHRIPNAKAELSAAVTTAEAAVTRIMESAEAILNVSADDPEQHMNQVTDHVLAILEACSFQDLMGQRLAKAVETFEHIERRLGNFAETTGIADAEGHLTEDEAKAEKRKEALILHGPQHEGDGITQDAIDAMFG